MTRRRTTSNRTPRSMSYGIVRDRLKRGPPLPGCRSQGTCAMQSSVYEAPKITKIWTFVVQIRQSLEIHGIVKRTGSKKRTWTTNLVVPQPLTYLPSAFGRPKRGVATG